MKKFIAWVMAMAMLTGGIAATAQSGGTSFEESLKANYKIPAREYFPETRWWLAEGSHTDETLRESMGQVKDMGLSAVEFVTLDEQGVDRAKYSWGSDEWIADSHTIIEAATELGLGVSFTAGTHWGTTNIPSIGPDDKAASQELAVVTQDAPAGTTFDGVIAAPQTTETVTKQTLVAVTAARVVGIGENGETLIDSLTECTELATQTDEGCQITWTAPDDGDYVLFVYWQRGTGQISNPSVGTNYAINYFARDGIDAFMAYWDEHIFTDEMMRLINDNGNVQLFMDSLEISRSGGFVYWADALRDEFITRKGYDVMTYMPLMTGQYRLDDAVLSDKVYNDFYDVMTQLYIEYCMEPLADYVHSKGLKFRAQISYGQQLEASLPIQTLDYVESESLNANDQPDVYRVQSGAAHLYSINEFSSETAATWANYSFSLQHILQNPIYTAFLGGVNRIIYHGYASIWGPEGVTTWPGHEGMYGSVSERFDERQPFYEDLPAFNAHLARIQQALRYGKPQIDVGILNLEYQFRTAYGMEYSALQAHEGIYWPDVNMQNAGYTYEYFNPQILTQENIAAAGGLVDPDGVAYQALIVWQEALPLDVAELLVDYAKAGVKILIVDGAAQHTPFNDGQDEALAKAIEALRASSNVAQIATEADATATLAAMNVSPRADFAEPNQALMTVLRADQNAAYLFVNNYTQPTETTAQENENLAEGERYMKHFDESTAISIDTTISVDGLYVPYEIDTWSGDVNRLASYAHEDGRTVIPVSLVSGDAALYAFEPVAVDENIVIMSTTADEAVVVGGSLAVRAFQSGTYETTLSNGDVVTSKLAVSDPVVIDNWHLVVEDWKQGEWVTRTEERDGYTTVEGTYLTTKDEIEVGIDELKGWMDIEEIGPNVSGVGHYSATFTLPEGFTAQNGAYIDLGDLDSSASVTVNGIKADPVNLNRARLDISSLVRDGDNTLEIRVATTLTNRLLEMGVIQAGIANLWMPFPRYVTGLYNYGLKTAQIIPYAQVLVG